jgi:glycosyltransferase involved in cell wall biosynthesis
MAAVRVLQAIAGAHHGGAEEFFTRLVPALARAGLDQRVVIRRDEERAGALRKQGVEAVELPFGGFFDCWTRARLRREIKVFAPHVVFTWMNRATRKCPRPRNGTPFVHVARLGGYYDLHHYRGCDHLIGNTVDIVDYLRKSGWPTGRAHYLPNFVDATQALPLARGTVGTPGSAPLVLALGRLHRNKAFDVLLDALAELPEVHCWIAGEGTERKALEAQATRLGLGARLRLLGWRNDTAALLAAADLLVCPSRHEPLGNVVIEAWARGVPVVAAASQGPAAIVEDGNSGLLVPVNDAPALAHGIRRVLNDKMLAAQIGAGGRAAFERDYTETAVVARYIEFFEKVTAQCAA